MARILGDYCVRAIAPGDAEHLAYVHVATWKATYPGMVDQARLDALRPADRVPMWEKTIDDRDDAEARGVRTRCAVHLPSGRIVGFGTSGPTREQDPPAAMSLWALYLLPEHHGTGIAGLLLEQALPEAAGRAYLWVAAGNARAIAFYRKHGFELDGAEKFDPDWQCQEARMVRQALRGG